MQLPIIYNKWRVDIVDRIKNTDAPFYRPPLPQQESEGVHPGMLTLMKQCWAEEPSERPSFVEVVCFVLFYFKQGMHSCLVLAAHYLIPILACLLHRLNFLTN